MATAAVALEESRRQRRGQIYVAFAAVAWSTAGLARVAATGVVVARKRRAQHDYDPDELRDRLHRRLAETATDTEGATAPAGDPTAPPEDR